MRTVIVGIVAVVVVFAMVPPIAQDPAYHGFADRRSLLGIPNGLDVLSNLLFALVGLRGLGVVMDRRSKPSSGGEGRWEEGPYLALFFGTLLTAFGSAYYHLAPDNGRLVWDRLPMTFGFMGLFTAVIAERTRLAMGRILLLPLLLIGAASVGYWSWSEAQGRGDLRPYGIVQYGSMGGMALLVLLKRGRYEDRGYLIGALLSYVLAKGLEAADQRIFAWGQILSGHTLKHLAAAGAVAWVVSMLRVRQQSGLAGRKKETAGPAPTPARGGGAASDKGVPLPAARPTEEAGTFGNGLDQRPRGVGAWTPPAPATPLP